MVVLKQSDFWPGFNVYFQDTIQRQVRYKIFSSASHQIVDLVLQLYGMQVDCQHRGIFTYDLLQRWNLSLLIFSAAAQS